MLEVYYGHRTKPKLIAELKKMLQVVTCLTQRPIDKAVKEFIKRLRPCFVAKVGTVLIFTVTAMLCCFITLLERRNFAVCLLARFPAR